MLMVSFRDVDSGAVAGQKRMIIMSSLFMMDKFPTNSSIAADGTFFSRPAVWRQIYAWHLRIKNTFVPAVVVFMGERTERANTEMLGAISEIIRQSFGREWTVEQVMTEFELAIRLAVRRQFGTGVIHLSCYFYYSYCLRKKLKKLKLKKMQQGACFQSIYP
uniref:MULE transposase domain-containing protein n=1 Tax=Ditylenchus dipsaci TaxID=166011 RepID=A0A915D8X5_9BILA